MHVAMDVAVPSDQVMPGGAQTAFILLAGAAAVVVWIYAVRESRRRGDWVPVFIVAGSGLSVFYEPLGDIISKVYYTEQDQLTWINAFGRDIPVFIGLLYFWYMSLGALWLLRACYRGVSAREWWTRWVGYLVFALALEFVAAGLLDTADGAPWTYYDHQAFMVLDVPFFTPWTYVSIDVAIALGTVTLAHFLPRGQRWIILPATPMLMIAGHATTAFPSALAMHSTDNEPLLHAGALATAGLCVMLAYLASRAFRTPWSRPTAEALRAEERRGGKALHVQSTAGDRA